MNGNDGGSSGDGDDINNDVVILFPESKPASTIASPQNAHFGENNER